MSLIYEPQEDSFLFMDFLRDCFETKNVNEKSVLDMGCGSCILGETLRDLGFIDILCVDVNEDAVKLAKEKGFRALKSDLFEEVDSCFDLILFNAPYLPRDELEDEESSLATSGGKRGDEIALRFLEEAKDFLKDKGVIYLLISSLTPLENIKKFKFEVVKKKKMFFEELLILKFNFNSLVQ